MSRLSQFNTTLDIGNRVEPSLVAACCGKDKKMAQTRTITIIANGQPRTILADSTVADLLRELKISPTYVVVQLEGVIVPRPDFAQTVLREQSKVEIITLVGGG